MKKEIINIGDLYWWEELETFIIIVVKYSQYYDRKP